LEPLFKKLDEVVSWIYLAQDRHTWRVGMYAAANLGCVKWEFIDLLGNR